jgi:hypothetical protein
VPNGTRALDVDDGAKALVDGITEFSEEDLFVVKSRRGSRKESERPASCASIQEASRLDDCPVLPCPVYRFNLLG